MNTTTTLADQLEALVDKLPEKDVTFATGLIASTRAHGETMNRIHWLQTLIKRAEGAAPPTPTQAPVSLGSFTKVMGLFSCAKEHLQRPKIRLQLETGHKVELALAGPTSKYPGTVNVTDGKGYGVNRWYGRVTEAGEWTRSGKDFDELPQVECLLKELGEKPIETAGHYGRLTGRCCFCNLPLKDEQSTAVGFGPVCADHYGLAGWRKEAATILERAERRGV